MLDEKIKILQNRRGLHRALRLNPTPGDFLFSPSDIADLYLINEEFKKAIDSKKYIYLENKLILKSDKCLQRDENGHLSPVEFTEDTLPMYCLSFAFYVTRTSGGTSSGSCYKHFRARPSFSRVVKQTLREASLAPSLKQTDIDTLCKALQDKPGETFSSILIEHMNRNKITVETLAEQTGLSVKTIQRMRTEPEARPKLESVIAVCLGLSLYPDESQELLNLAGYTLRNRPKERAYFMLLNYFFEKGIVFCNEFLMDLKIKPLTDLHE